MPFRDRRQQQTKEPEEKTIEINAEMNGSLAFKEPVNLKINGIYSGSLDVKGTLTIASHADVHSDIRGDNVVIAGKVTGNVTVEKVLVLMPTAVLIGDINAPKLNIVEGAVFEGRCSMTLAGIEDPLDNEIDLIQENFLNVDQLASYLELEQPTILELANSGKIPAVKDKNGWKFDKLKIDDWASSGRVA